MAYILGTSGGDSIAPGTVSAGVAGQPGTGDDLAFGFAGDDAVDGGAGDDTIYGGSGDDVLVGGDGNDTFFDGIDGVDGNDVLDGGAGIDLVDYSGFPVANVVADLTTGVATGFGSDTLLSIEGLRGGDGADQFTGSAASNRLEGGFGSDVLAGADGNDMLIGGGDNDTLLGGAGDDQLMADDGTNMLDGGEGFDLAVFVSLSAPLDVDLGRGTVSRGPFTDSVVDIERFVLSQLGDLAKGDDAANRFDGEGGNDRLNGGGGGDTLNGDAGDDRLAGELGQDAMAGGDGVDRLDGGEGDDALNGGAGDDRLVGGSGQDYLTGGDGNDRFLFAATGESAPDAPDVILLFEPGRDRIDLSAIDADGDAANGDSRLKFIGDREFTGKAGQLRFEIGTYTLIEADTNGDRVADLALAVFGNAPVGADWFIR